MYPSLAKMFPIFPVPHSIPAVDLPVCLKVWRAMRVHAQVREAQVQPLEAGNCPSSPITYQLTKKKKKKKKEAQLMSRL
jgi:hypothetical protein